MNYNRLKEFIEFYVKNYEPFRDSEFYKKIIDYLKDNYLNDSYNNIPIELDFMYNKQELPKEAYDIRAPSRHE